MTPGADESLRDRRSRAGLTAAIGALVVGSLYALVSAYWGAGGTRLLGTVGGTLGSAGRSRTAWVIALLWAVVVLKLAAAALPLVAIDPRTRAGPARLALAVGWLVGWVLTVYGLVLTATGLLVESAIVHPGRGADHRALAYHAFLWDPWFLVWGLIVLAALRHIERPRRGGASP
jgi:hypothetical protein